MTPTDPSDPQLSDTLETAPEAASPRIPVLALVGRPNVGKSTLFNRLTRSRDALVAPIPGVTRDRREQMSRVDGFRFKLIDTGGVSFSRESDFAAEIAAQVQIAIESADIVWLVLDGGDGLNPYDRDLFRALQKQSKPTLVIVNKSDNNARQHASAEFYALGAAQVYPVSALHGTGLPAALADSAKLVPTLLRAPTPFSPSGSGGDMPVRVAFVGRPNAGKSSLVNRILGVDRQIVSDIAGTTREAVEIPFRIFDQDYVLVDTAGIRRRSRTKEYLEKLSVINALTAMEHAEVVVLVVDANEEVADQDARIAGYILEKGRGIIVAMNKWDLLQKREADVKEVEADIGHTLRFLEYAPRVRMSATTGFGLERLFKDIRIVGREFNREIQTADLNRVVQIAARQTPPPAKGRSPSKILYGTQTGTRPPAFRFFTNHPDSIPDTYARFMEHQLRYHFGFRGVPLKLDWRGRDGVEQGAAPHERPAPKRKKPVRPAGKPKRRSLNKLRAVKGKTAAKPKRSNKVRRGAGRS